MSSHDRLKGAAAALAVQGLLGWLLISGLTSSWRRLPESALTVVQLALPAPPPPAESKPPQPRHRAPPGHPSPPNLRATETDLVVPPPVIPPPLPAPVVAALQPSTGAQAASGAALVAGVGTGAGGAGNGDGGGGSLDVPPRQIRGQIGNSDYPERAAREGRSGGVDIRYLVEVDGRIGTCRIVQSSGSPDLDALTCRLAQQRFRFAPARDASGRRVPAWVDDGVEWVNRQPPAAVGIAPPAEDGGTP